MRKHLPILLLMLSLLSVLIFEFVAEASSNLTGYASLTKFYSEVPRNPDGSLPEYHSFTNDDDTYNGYIGKFRVFVPPGTISVALSIIENGRQMAVARYMIPPTGKPDEPPIDYTPDHFFSLAELTARDCWATENMYDILGIASDSFLSYLESSKAGWLYANVGGGEYAYPYNNNFTAIVKSDVYNAWWHDNIKDKAGWDKYVEGVETYTDPPNPSSAQPTISVTPLNQSVPLSAGTTTFNVSNTGTGTMSWVAVVTEGTDWLTVTSFTSGNSGAINCSYAAYAAGSVTRSGKIRIVSNGATNSPVEVTVTQNGATTPVLTVTPTDQMVPLSAGTTTFNVSNTGKGTMPWTAMVIEGDWLKITEGATGTDSGTITCSYGTVSSTRTGKIQITANGATGSPAYVTVTQSPTVVPILTVTPTSQSVPLSAGTTTFNVSNTGKGTMPWTAVVIEGDWLKITEGASGTGSGAITCSYETASSTRTGKIRITANDAKGSPAEVTVTQAGATMPVLTVTPLNQSVPFSAGTTTFTVSNTGATVVAMPWTAAVIDGGDWLKITSGDKGTDSGTITCSYGTTSSVRTGNIKISADSAPNAPVYVTVTQNGTEPSGLSVTPSNQTVPLSGGTTTFSISNTGSGTMPWTVAVTEGDKWLTITSSASGVNSGTITCSCTAASSTRTGKIRITATNGAKGSPADVTVTQSGTMVSMPVPATGQKTCFDDNGNLIDQCPTPGQAFYGQDANYQKINPMSYTRLDVSGNALDDKVTSWAMVRDNVTGLIWDVTPDKKSKQSGVAQIINQMNETSYGGFSDWRLPTIKELSSLVTYQLPYKEPVINTEYFLNTKSAAYWTSTPYAFASNYSWTVDFTIGLSNISSNDSDCYVCAVRGDRTDLINFTDNGNGTVTDNITGLMWENDESSSGSKTWQDALYHCENLSIGGYTDWRMPTIKELGSLVDHSQTKSPSINSSYFNNTEPVFYWSSTTTNHKDFANNAWVVDFKDGTPLFYSKSATYPVRAVRDLSMLFVTPSSISVSKDAGAVTLNVFISGDQTISWKAEFVGTAPSWLKIDPTNTNSNHGTIKCTYNANPSAEIRTATIRVTAAGAELNSQMGVTISQAPSCVATLSNSLILNIPYLNYSSTNQNLWASFSYDEKNSTKEHTYYKLTDDYGIITNPSITCTAAATMSSDYKIHIPSLLMLDGTSMCMDMIYRPDITSGTYFEAIGVCSN